MDPYATLGLSRSYNIDKGELERRYRELQRSFHPDKHTGATPSERRMMIAKAMEINEAYRTLRDDLKRAEALLRSYGASVPDRVDEAFLMEMMEQREELAEAKQSGDMQRVKTLAERVGELDRREREALGQAFDRVARAPAADDLEALGMHLSRMKYFARFLDEVAAIEEEALS